MKKRINFKGGLIFSQYSGPRPKRDKENDGGLQLAPLPADYVGASAKSSIVLDPEIGQEVSRGPSGPFAALSVVGRPGRRIVGPASADTLGTPSTLVESARPAFAGGLKHSVPRATSGRRTQSGSCSDV